MAPLTQFNFALEFAYNLVPYRLYPETHTAEEPFCAPGSVGRQMFLCTPLM